MGLRSAGRLPPYLEQRLKEVDESDATNQSLRGAMGVAGAHDIDDGHFFGRVAGDRDMTALAADGAPAVATRDQTRDTQAGARADGGHRRIVHAGAAANLEHLIRPEVRQRHCNGGEIVDDLQEIETERVAQIVDAEVPVTVCHYDFVAGDRGGYGNGAAAQASGRRIAFEEMPDGVLESGVIIVGQNEGVTDSTVFADQREPGVRPAYVRNDVQAKSPRDDPTAKIQASHGYCTIGTGRDGRMRVQCVGPGRRAFAKDSMRRFVVSRPWLWLCRKLLFLVVRTTVLPEGAGAGRVSGQTPVCYVIETGGLSNLLVLDREALKHGLPRPVEPMLAGGREWSAVLSLRRLRGFFVKRYDRTLPPDLGKMVQAVRSGDASDIRIVPVSIFWGRAPEKQKSWFKLLFSETWAPVGAWRKLLIILMNGRQTFVEFSKPLSVSAFLAEDPNLSDARLERKVSRVLRVHFRRQRIAAIGPDLSHRRILVNEIVGSRDVRQAVAREIRTGKVTQVKAEAQARKYAREIAADYSYSAIRLMDALLSRLWNRLYDGVTVNHVERVKEVAAGSEVVYVPCHRSHIDYLLLSYVLYYQAFVPPHIAAGINLNLPVVGRILRRCGAFFIRRSFRGNQLYTAVFQKYLSLNIARGFPIEYFVEGTRSRTGRLLRPRSGMLAMTARTYLRDSDRPVVFVPVYFGYERLVEGQTYIGELSGRPKRSESLMGILRSFRALRSQFGKVYVNFGEPIELAALLDEHRPDWREVSYDNDDRPPWLVPAVSDLADRILTHVNKAAAVTPVSLLALSLLSTPRQAMLESGLVGHLDLLLGLARRAPYSAQITLPEMDGSAVVAYCEKMQILGRQPHPLGDILRLEGKNAVLMTYFRNNLLHLFALPSMIACCFLNNRSMDTDTIVRLGRMVYPYVRAELFLHWSLDEFGAAIARQLAVMVETGLLVEEDGGARYQRPAAGTAQAVQLSVLAEGAVQTLERYYMTVALLLKHGSGTISQSDLERLCQLMAQRMSLLHEFNAPEFFARDLFRGFIDTLRKSEVVWNDDDGLLAFDKRILDVDSDARLVLSEQIRHSILQVTHV